MAERRMFSKTVIDSDLFLDMPLSSQSLYFHLSMRADDDGFINNPRKVQRVIGASDDDLKLLIAKQFIIPFESGIVVIKHWKIHNYIQKDRYKPTIYAAEKSLLNEGENREYTECIQNVSGSDTQVRLGKVRLGKVRLDKDSLKEKEINNTSSVQTPDEPVAETTLWNDSQGGFAHTVESEGTNALSANKKTNNTSSVQMQDEPVNEHPSPKEQSAIRFDTFWEAYPKKIGKGAAKKAWAKIKPSETLLQEMLKAIETARRTEQWQRDNGQYIPNPATWLNQERWDDEYGARGRESDMQGPRYYTNQDGTRIKIEG